MSLLVTVQVNAQTDIKDLTQQGDKRIAAGQKSQQEINRLDDQVQALETEYSHNYKVLEGIQTYNRVLQKQTDQQAAEIKQLQASIENAADIERQVLPLIVRMIDSLEQFVAADSPFLLKERQARVAALKQLLSRADVSSAEMLNKVMDAYHEENQYGRTIESYSGQLALNGKTENVDFLRVGRIALLYQTLDGQKAGAWNSRARQWVELDANEYRRYLRQGMKVARKQAAPDFLMMPVFGVDAVTGGDL